MPLNFTLNKVEESNLTRKPNMDYNLNIITSQDELAKYLDEEYITKDDISEFIACDVNMFNQTFGLDDSYFTYLNELMTIFFIENPNTYNPHVAGGLIRRIFNGEKFDENFNGDIDFFFAEPHKEYDYDHQERFTKFLLKVLDKEVDKDTLKSIDKNKNVKISDKHEYQIMGKAFDNVYHIKHDRNGSKIPIHDLTKEDYLNSIIFNLGAFDQHINMAGIHFRSEHIVMHKTFMYNNAIKKYTFNTSERNRSHPLQVFHRLNKFTKEGYSFDGMCYKHMGDFVIKHSGKMDRPDEYFENLPF